MLFLSGVVLGLQLGARCPPPVAQAAATTSITTIDAAKIFGRFAEQTLYLDPTVGVCCHSACSDCEWRTPDGGYRFDIMKAATAKWIPCYLSRDFQDERGAHSATWFEALFPDGATSISRAEFGERLGAMPYVSSMGPKGTVKEPELSAEALDAFWEWLCDEATAEALEPATIVKRFQSSSLAEDQDGAVGEGPDSLVWKEFAKGLGAAPFERF